MVYSASATLTFQVLVVGMINRVSNTKRSALFLAARLTLLAMLATSVGADDHERAHRLRESGDIVPLEHILERALSLYPGRVIEVELEYEDERWVYEIEIVDERGVVWELEFDAGSGRLLEEKRER